MFNFHTATTWDKEVTLAWFLYRMDMKTREALMDELPETYNRLYGQRIVVSVKALHTDEKIRGLNVFP